MYPAVAAREVDVIAAYTSDGRIREFQLRVLDDPKSAIPPYDAILLVSARRAADEEFLAALQPLTNAISLEAMREANQQVGGGISPEAVARTLAKKIGR